MKACLSMVGYFSSTPYRPVLITNTRNSSPSSFFCVSIVVIKWLETNVYRINLLSNFRIHKVGAYSMASLISSKSSLLSFVHLKLKYLFIISCSGFTISMKSKMNLLMKFIFPRKDCMAFLLCGSTIDLIASILPGSIFPLERLQNRAESPLPWQRYSYQDSRRFCTVDTFQI